MDYPVLVGFIVLGIVLVPIAYVGAMALLGAYLDNKSGLWIAVPMIVAILIFAAIIA